MHIKLQKEIKNNKPLPQLSELNGTIGLNNGTYI